MMSNVKLLLLAAATLALGQNSSGPGCDYFTGVQIEMIQIIREPTNIFQDLPSSYQVPFNASGKVTVQQSIGQDTAKTDLIFERSVSWRNSASGDNTILHQAINLKYFPTYSHTYPTSNS